MTSGTLAIDVSNIHTSVALWYGEEAVSHWRFASDASRTSDEYHVLLARLLARDGHDRGSVRACVIGCVVPEMAHTMVYICRSLFDLEPLVVGPGVHTGLRIDTSNPHEVGADRIANGVAASARYGSPVLVLDFGTALTVDVVSGEGAYIGAVIAPGLEVAAEGLARRAARIGRIDLVTPPCAIADNTVQALQAGLVYGYVGLIEGLVERVQSEVGKAHTVATGEAPLLHDLLALTDAIEAYAPLLTLDGLRRIQARHEGFSS